MNVARLERDVLALSPDLVLWQVGTNDALRGLDPALVRKALVEGIRRVRAAGADIVLIDPQLMPDVPAGSAVLGMVEMIGAAAEASGVPVLRRYELMRYWIAVSSSPHRPCCAPTMCT